MQPIRGVLTPYSARLAFRSSTNCTLHQESTDHGCSYFNSTCMQDSKAEVAADLQGHMQFNLQKSESNCICPCMCVATSASQCCIHVERCANRDERLTALLSLMSGHAVCCLSSSQVDTGRILDHYMTDHHARGCLNSVSFTCQGNQSDPSMSNYQRIDYLFKE